MHDKYALSFGETKQLCHSLVHEDKRIRNHLGQVHLTWSSELIRLPRPESWGPLEKMQLDMLYYLGFSRSSVNRDWTMGSEVLGCTLGYVRSTCRYNNCFFPPAGYHCAQTTIRLDSQHPSKHSHPPSGERRKPTTFTGLCLLTSLFYEVSYATSGQVFNPDCTAF